MRMTLCRIGLWLVAVLGILGGGAGPADAAAPARSDRVVVMISVDGLAGFYLDDPHADMPTIRQLADDGARAASMRASAPTVTWPNHATLVTGVTPARHGIVGNNFYDRATGKVVTLIGDPVFDKDQILRVPTVYDLAKRVGLRTAAVRWPVTRNARSLDWVVPDIASDALVARYTTPALLAEATDAGIWFAPKSFDIDTGGHAIHRDVRDQTAVTIFDRILHERRPQLALLHLENVDHTQHAHGPRSAEAYAAIQLADRQVRQVWDELKQDFPGTATLVVVSDHGFAPVEHKVLPNVILRDAGLLTTKGGRVTGGAVRVVVQGGAAFVYVTDPAKGRAAVLDRVRKAFDGATGVEKVVGPDGLKAIGAADPADDPHAADMIVFAKEGFSFGSTAAGALPFTEKPERSGTHGNDPSLPDLHATFVAWGAGIRPGTKLGEISNTDVAPTIAKLLGIEMPDVDGKVLTAALAR